MTLPLTGERTVPGVPEENYWFRRHEAAYRWLVSVHRRELQGATVVEAGAGEGYGADLLVAGGARAVVALDYDAPTCRHLATRYPDVDTVQANLGHLPLAGDRVDVFVSMQVVEHLWELRGFLRDAMRTLRPGGLLVLSTPNRLTFSPGLGREERPTNPFHVEEFDAEQLSARVERRGFVAVEVRGLHHGPRLRAWEQANGRIVDAQVAAVIEGRSDAALADLVAGVEVSDFVVAAPTELPVDGAVDLVLTARRP